jgi:flavin-binding protein dodecin
MGRLRHERVQVRPQPQGQQFPQASLRELRVAEVVEQDLVVEDGKVKAYRTKVKVSFKYES